MNATAGRTHASTKEGRPDLRSPANWAALARHVICVLALMWTGLVNGQPFFFADTANYIRAADAAAHIASGKAVSTVWTDRYRAALSAKDGDAAKPAAAPPRKATANDVGAGLIMSGRSPYIGALMYLGWMTGWFWPFVVFQAVVAYLLIILTLRRFGVDRPHNVLLVTLGLAATTALPTYNSLLLADGFASFGILAFLLIATPGRLTRWQFVFLVAVLAIFVTAHLTHLMMLIGMVGVIALLALTRWMRPPPRAWIVGVAGIAFGFGAVQATAVATRAAFGREPQLLPLMTARFWVDGPGKAFIDSGCEGRRFQVCRVRIDRPPNNSGWLFSNDPHEGVYMPATPEQRRRMGEEDVPFALAVIRHDPIGQIGMMAYNTALQASWIDYDGLNYGCFDKPDCWDNLPPSVRETMRATLSGRNAWPQAAMNALLYVVVIASFVALVFAMRRLRRSDPAAAAALRDWLLVGGGAMLVCSFFGGAVAEPQYRYQGRLIWLVVLMAAVALLKAYGERRRAVTPLPRPAW